MSQHEIVEILNLLDGSLVIENGTAIIVDKPRLQAEIYRLAEISAFETGVRQGVASYITRLAALALGIYPASIHELYKARSRFEIPASFTVPAINLRMLTFDAARVIFKVAQSIDGAAFIFEIARSEMSYTNQRPSEYVTSVLAAAISAGYTGPVFIQGDHFQVSLKRYTTTPEVELQALHDLIKEAIASGFYNIDIDSSTLVDITRPSVIDQQVLNCRLSAMFSAYIRAHQPEGVEISIGGEIGEVGGHNSTEEELRAYMGGYAVELDRALPGTQGLSKVSIQTGTSHGGVVLPDGSIAQVAVDFNTLYNLSQVARREYGMGGAVQHGASTLPDEAFGKFVEAEAIEVHLATNFQNIIYEFLPAELKADMYRYLDETNATERKPGMTDEQFYYKTRKNAIGPFKKQIWMIDAETKAEISSALETQFRKLFTSLGVASTRSYVDNLIKPILVKPDIRFYLGGAATEEDVSDLAD